MSSQNAYPGPSAGRPAARPANQERPRQPAWVHPQGQPGQAPQPAANGWPQQPVPGYGAQAPQQPAAYGQWSDLQRGHAGQAGHVDPYAPQFEPYVPPAYGHQQQTPAYGAQPTPQWPGRGADPRGFDAGGYAVPSHAPQAMPQAAHGAAAYGDRQYHESELSSADWAGQPGGFGHEPYQQGPGAELGFAQPEGGELDAAYGEEDVEYEDEEAPRGRRPMMIAAALVGAILVGGGVAYGYKKFASLDPQGDPPIIKSEAFPSKTKPADAGGKQFPYSDSKIMGRLGDGTSSASASDANSSNNPSSDNSAGASGAPSADDGGTRKVATLVVGRDGTIQPPAAAPASDPPSSQVGVPGTSLVDVFGGQGASVPPSAPATNDSASMKPTSKPVAADDMPLPPKKTTITPVKIAKINSAGSSKPLAATTGSIAERDDAAAPTAPPAKKPKKVARAETTVSDAESDSAPVTSSGGTGGFVAVLASVPQSASSRMDALKRFADMQEKYGTALAGKTPDVADANLGAKGNYHRLIVGPPGSREQASTVCSQLKSQGYNDCWVTSY